MKFIHIADVHLGANPDLEYPWGADRKREIWNTFRRVIEETKREKADLLLIAGDLFHRQPLKKELKEVNGLFRSIPDTKVVLIAGNHDFIQKNSNYRTFSWASNVTGLWGRELEMAEFPEINTCVYGLSYWSREIREPLYEGIYSGKPAGFQILLAHGGDEK
ncbi:MAG TPA: DNA repair exonuclease, partial [Candidatus Blautia avistercoris]|nr:DNA repair exonuclease [Candidatus Blautia avistercoris]